MRILFVITGIGLGHIIREIALINEIQKNILNAEIKIAGFKNSYNYFKDKFPLVKIIGHKFPETSFTVNQFKTLIYNLPYPLYFLHDAIKLFIEIKKFKPDLIIVDAEPVGAFIGKITKTKTISIYNLDLNRWNEFIKERKLTFSEKIQSKFMYKQISKVYERANIVLIPSLKYKSVNTEKFHYINPMVRTISEDLPDEKTLMKKLNLKKKPILIMLGGSTFGFSVAQHIVNISKKFKENFIIFGFENFKTKNVMSYKFKENFLEYLKICKGIIIIAGHNTLSEAIVFKKPALVFPFKHYVEHYINVYKLEDFIMVRDLQLVSQEEIEDSIKTFLNKINELEKNMKKLNVKGDGASRAFEIIFNQS